MGNDLRLGEELRYLPIIGLRSDRGARSDDTDPSRHSALHGFLGRRDENAQDLHVRMLCRQPLLLDAPQRFGGSGITRQDHELHALPRQELQGLCDVCVNGFLAAAAVGHACSVTEIGIVVLGEQFPDFPQHRQSADTGIEKGDHTYK